MKLFAVNLIKGSVETWSSALDFLGEELAKVEIWKGMRMRNSLSSLFFIASLRLLPTNQSSFEVVFQDFGFKNSHKLNQLNHLLFMGYLNWCGKSQAVLEAMAGTVRTLSDDVRTRFGLRKYVTVALNWRTGHGTW